MSTQPDSTPAATAKAPDKGIGCDELVRRLGRFRIQRPLVRTLASELRSIFGEMVIVHAEMRWDTDSIEYVAMCDRFDVLEEGLEAPLYQLTLHTQEDGKLIILDVRKGIFA
jgi:hypothetical protein